MQSLEQRDTFEELIIRIRRKIQTTFGKAKLFKMIYDNTGKDYASDIINLSYEEFEQIANSLKEHHAFYKFWRKGEKAKELLENSKGKDETFKNVRGIIFKNLEDIKDSIIKNDNEALVVEMFNALFFMVIYLQTQGYDTENIRETIFKDIETYLRV